MLDHDSLLYVFKFLDFSHVPTLCLVCSDWNEIASGNALWEWYFHMMSNNKKGKTGIETTVLENNNVFWRNMIRDHFSKHEIRTTNKISSNGVIDLSRQMDFMNHSIVHPYLNQLTKFICGRIKVEKVYYSGDGGKMHPFTKDVDFLVLENFRFIELKIKMRISGLDECIIARTRYGYGFFLFGYDYFNGTSIYISTETHDTINEHLQNPYSSSNDPVSFLNMNMLQNCFLYIFNGKGNAPTLRGEQYLEDHVLSKCIPTHTQWNLSPRSAIPLLCFIVTCITGKLDCFSGYKKEFTHAYPDIANNTFMYYLKYAVYSERVRSRIPLLRQSILSTPCNLDVNICRTVNQMIEGKTSVTVPANRNTRKEYWRCLQSKVISPKQQQTFFPDLFQHGNNNNGVVSEVNADVIRKKILSYRKAFKRLEHENELLEHLFRYKANKFL
ncbi:hypothetical protein C9374_003103 [Naegleria lovaniensis]|uniref:F-box domain-containing protein n=1 Tax=Naegleria lovaniensis TaxID=51637 RepID=A0AA88GUE9_NAELO|nr:uncharacterized protein C9374_003103 [Naegleria lovaniensis]KAG2385954.1 hypothetical protein C9374_003103 [Naegleria lovaniensis]